MSFLKSQLAAIGLAVIVVAFAIVSPGAWIVGLAVGFGLGALALRWYPRTDDPRSAWAFRAGTIIFAIVTAAAAYEISEAVRTGQALGETVLGVVAGGMLAVTIGCELTARRLYRVRTPR